ncbi:MAG: thioredoxin family protein [Smithella sp.]|jgi:thioredoxin-like negative regulator of GroEL|nr:thioredoxin family protein [Smithella sp.]
MNLKIEVVGEGNFQTALARQKQPVLVMCMPRDDRFEAQRDALTAVVGKYNSLLAAVVIDEQFIAAFKREYKVSGTPTFVLLEGGREIGRVLGLADESMLEKMIEEAYPSPGGQTRGKTTQVSADMKKANNPIKERSIWQKMK